MSPQSITGCVLTKNEERSIKQCLESLSFCDEILVIDSHSTDLTREIAISLGAKVIERDWPGFRSQREFALSAAAYNWILFLDADECLSREGVELIRTVRDTGRLDEADGYWLPRKNQYYGRYIAHGDWRSDRGIRLFDRRKARIAGREVHEHVSVEGKVSSLSAAVLHNSYEDLEDQLGKLSGYARLMAEELHREGRRTSFLACVVNPLWRFVRSYFLRLGFMDGWRGYVIALVEAQYVREKYLRLLVMNQAPPPSSNLSRSMIAADGRLDVRTD